MMRSDEPGVMAVSKEDAASAATVAWSRQSVWSQAANQAKRLIVRARLTVLGLTVVGAVMGTASAQTAGGSPAVARILAGVATVALGLVPLTAKGTSRERIQAWTRTRSVSEALKTDLYLY